MYVLADVAEFVLYKIVFDTLKLPPEPAATPLPNTRRPADASVLYPIMVELPIEQDDGFAWIVKTFPLIEFVNDEFATARSFPELSYE
jgi:hypothetical protein